MQFTIYVSVLISITVPLLTVLKYFEIGASLYKLCIWISVISFSIFVFIWSISILLFGLQTLFLNVGDYVKVFGKFQFPKFPNNIIITFPITVDFRRIIAIFYRRDLQQVITSKIQVKLNLTPCVCQYVANGCNCKSQLETLSCSHQCHYIWKK